MKKEKNCNQEEHQSVIDVRRLPISQKQNDSYAFTFSFRFVSFRFFFFVFFYRLIEINKKYEKNTTKLNDFVLIGESEDILPLGKSHLEESMARKS